ncbi:MAG: putative sialic acid synthase [Phycisphaerales bacterium]|nr:putative sialic acid synthase [Phycisphaerales bacterium]
MKIGPHTIGQGQPVFIVAEIGVNHDGSVDRALELVRHAKAAGADAVKLQVFCADTLVHRSAEFAEYQKDRVDAADPAEMLRQYELSDTALATIAGAAAAQKIALICTPFSRSDVPRAAAVSSAIKIASPDIVNRLLLIDVIATGLPMIVSTGATTADEISSAVRWISAQGTPFALLHCVSNYPVEESDAQLCWIQELAKHGVPVGYSDHVSDPVAGALSVAFGASIIEKHLTYDCSAAGPDHSASLEPVAMADYIHRIRQAERMMGRPGRRVLRCEEDVRRVSRQSLVLKASRQAGHTLTLEDLTTQRPGTGLSAELFETVLGRTLARSVRAGDMLSMKDVA